MTARCIVMLLLLAGGCTGKGETAVTARWKTEFKEAYAYVPPATAADDDVELSREPVLELEPMTITRSLTVVDVLAEARRKAELKQARKFSPLKGGTLLSFPRADLGFWATIVPDDAIPGKRRGSVLLSVDLLRIKW